MNAFADFIEAEKFPSYQTLSVTLGANGIYTVNQTFDSFAVLESSGSMKMSLNEQSESDFDAGIQMRAPANKAFTSMRLRETAGAAANFRLLLSFGDVRDSRANISGNVSVQNAAAPNDSLLVDMAAADAGLVALAASLNTAADADFSALITALQASNALRNRYTSLDGASYASYTGSSSADIVAAGTNTNGILVKLARVGSSDGQVTRLNFNGNTICGYEKDNGSNIWAEIRDVYLPSGSALAYVSPTNGYVQVRYEVL